MPMFSWLRDSGGRRTACSETPRTCDRSGQTGSSRRNRRAGKEERVRAAHPRCPGEYVLAGSLLLAPILGCALLLMSTTAKHPNGLAPIPASVGHLMEMSLASRCPRCPPWSSFPMPGVPGPPLENILEWRRGHVAFRDPGPMRVGITKDIEVRICVGDDLPGDFTANLAGTGPIQIITLPLMDAPAQLAVRMHLAGDPAVFRIVRLLPPDSDSPHGEQLVTEGGISSWLWEVTPQEAGHHELLLSIAASADASGHNPLRWQRVPKGPTTVADNRPYEARRFVSSNWRWLLGTPGLGLLGLLGLLGGAVWAKKKHLGNGRRRRDNPKVNGN